MESYPSKAIRYDLLVVLVGLACTLAVEHFVSNFSHSRFFTASTTLAFFLTSLNFVHGKAVALDDEDYNRALIHRPGFAILDFALNVSVVLAFVFMALYLENPRGLVISNIVVRGIDVAIVVLVMRISEDSAVNRAQRSWLLFDFFALAVFGSALTLLLVGAIGELPVAAVFLTVIVLDILVDYSYNYRMYFSSAGSWKEMADVWDTAQGEHGDIYRRSIIYPALASAYQFKDKKVLDLGCGNGCVPRMIEKLGANGTTAVDKYEEMIRVAKQYPSQVAYRQLDIEASQCRLDEQGFDVVIACFTLQDCESIMAPLHFIRENIADNGRAIIIFENDAAFGGEALRTTGRRALDPESTAGLGRRWLIFWDARFVSLSQSDTWTKQIEDRAAVVAAPLSKTRVTVTRHWSLLSYLRSAAIQQLELASWAIDLHVNGPAEHPIFRKYELSPKFSLLSLRRREDNVIQGPTRSLPLVLIAGVSGTGKSHLGKFVAENTEHVVVVNLDDFYRDKSDNKAPLRRGQSDWESADSIDLGAAAEAVDSLVRGQTVKIPKYDMEHNRVIGDYAVDACNAKVIVVQGLFAFDVFVPSAARISRVLLVGSRMRLFCRRIKRDLTERRRTFWHALLHALRLLLVDHRYEKRNEVIANFKYPCNLNAKGLMTQLWRDASLDVSAVRGDATFVT